MLPYKIVQDLNPAAAPENSSTLNVNVNFDILKQALINEQGFDKLSTTGKEIIGSTILPNNSICVFSVINISNVLYSEIGIIDDVTYKIVLRDTPSASLGFTTEHQIQAESKVNFNGDYIVYWVDGFNPDRWLNITTPQVDITFSALTNIPTIANAAQLGLMLGFTPTRGEYIDSTATTITGGSLTAAVYYIICTYGDKYKNFTQTLYVSSPIPVTASQLPFNNEYIGSAAGTVTDKAISISIAASRLNPEYDFIRVQVIRKQNQVLSGWNFGEFPFGTNDFTATIDALTNEVAVDAILINLANYKSSLAITQLDDVLYKAHLKTKAEFDFQPYVNNTVVNYKQKQITLDFSSAGNNYKDPNMCFYSKGFMYDEVYAFYQSFVIEEDGQEYETKAYHIPGRGESPINLGTDPIYYPLEGTTIIGPGPKVLVPSNYTSTYYVDGTINDCTPLSQLSRVSPQAKVMHGVATADNPIAVGLYGSNMGYWENDNENYADRNSWLVVDAYGAPIGDNRGGKVRHHRFPEPFVTSGFLDKDSIHPSSTDYSQVNILGVELSNIVIPVAYIGKVKKIKLYHAKREFNDRTVLGQSLMTSLSAFHVYEANYGSDNLVISGIGSLLHIDMPSNNSSPTHATGMFPLGYEETTGAAGSDWFDSDSYGGDNTQPTDPISGFYKLKPFDVMQQSLTTLTTSYIKNLYRIPSRYEGNISEGDLSSFTSTTRVHYIFDPSDNTKFYGGINRTIRAGVSPLANQYRKLTNIEYVDQNVPTSAGNAGPTPYSFSMYPYNFAGDKAIWAQTEKRLFYAVDNPGIFSIVNGDWGTSKFLDNPNFWSTNAAGIYASPYISNMCAFKVSLFTTFDNQILCEAGVVDVDGLKEFYGGDTFTSYYGERSTFDTQGYSPSNPTDFHGFIDTIHYYVSQSTGNINYRYKGDNTWETFYPKETWEFMRNLPFINPEWYGYNPDYSANNDLLQPVIGSNAASQFQDNFPNRVIRSATDNPEIMSDNYLIYEAGNYRDVGKAKGPIENIANQNSKLLIKTRKALFYTLGREIINTENSESYVGAGDIFAVKPKESVSSDSYGGGIGRFSDVITQYGYMYADATNGIVYVAAPASAAKGDSINEISNEGLQIFFRTELKFKLPEQLYNKYYSLIPEYNTPVVAFYLKDWYVKFNGEIWKSNVDFTVTSLTYPGQSSVWDKVDFYTLTDNTTDIQGIGIHATFDYKYRRYILAKKDYNFVDFPTEWLPNIPEYISPVNNGKVVYYNGIFYTLAASGTVLPRNNFGVKLNFAAYFEDKSFTIAYYPESKAWVSMYDYYPNFLFNTIDKVYSSKNTGVFKHNSNIQNNFYYDDTVTESFIEPILNTPAGVKKFSSISFYTDVFVKTATTKALQYLDTFTSYFVRNTWQMSKPTIIDNGNTSRNAERVFNTNDFRDFTKDNNEPLMDSKYIPQQNTFNLNVTKHWSLQKKFVDYFLIPRLIFKNKTSTVNLGVNVITLGLIDNANNIFQLYSPDYIFVVGNIISFIDYNGSPHIIAITEVLAGNNYSFINVVYGMTDDVNATTFSTFEIIENKEIHIYDISSQSTKNIR